MGKLFIMVSTIITVAYFAAIEVSNMYAEMHKETCSFR